MAKGEVDFKVTLQPQLGNVKEYEQELAELIKQTNDPKYTKQFKNIRQQVAGLDKIFEQSFDENIFKNAGKALKNILVDIKNLASSLGNIDSNIVFKKLEQNLIDTASNIKQTQAKIAAATKGGRVDEKGKFSFTGAELKRRVANKHFTRIPEVTGAGAAGTEIADYEKLIKYRDKMIAQGLQEKQLYKDIVSFVKELEDEQRERNQTLVTENNNLNKQISLQNKIKQEIQDIKNAPGNTSPTQQKANSIHTKSFVDYNTLDTTINSTLQEHKNNQKKGQITKEEIDGLNKSGEKNTTVFGKAIKNLTSYTLILGSLKSALRTAAQTIVVLDKAITEQAMVTGRTRKEMEGLIANYQNIAKVSGATTKEVASVATEYFRQGRSAKDALLLTEAAVSAAKVGAISTKESVDYLTTAINGFGMAAEDAMLVSDRFSALAAGSATNYEELAVALSKVASQANLAGMSMDYTLGLLAKGIETTREAPETIGTALKTIVARMREMTDYGKTLEDGVNINNLERQLSYVGIALRDSNGELRSTEKVLDEIGRSWDTFSANQQAALAKALAGTRQQSRLISLMQDYDRTLELVEISERSAGATAAQMSTYMTSLDAATNKVSVAWEELIHNFVNTKVVIETIEIVAKLLEGLGELLSSDFGIISTFTIIAAIAAKIYNYKKEAANIMPEQKEQIALEQEQQKEELKNINEQKEAEKTRIVNEASKEENQIFEGNSKKFEETKQIRDLSILRSEEQSQKVKNAEDNYNQLLEKKEKGEDISDEDINAAEQEVYKQQYALDEIDKNKANAEAKYQELLSKSINLEQKSLNLDQKKLDLKEAQANLLNAENARKELEEKEKQGDLITDEERAEINSNLLNAQDDVKAKEEAEQKAQDDFKAAMQERAEIEAAASELKKANLALDEAEVQLAAAKTEQAILLQKAESGATITEEEKAAAAEKVSEAMGLVDEASKAQVEAQENFNKTLAESKGEASDYNDLQQQSIEAASHLHGLFDTLLNGPLSMVKGAFEGIVSAAGGLKSILGPIIGLMKIMGKLSNKEERAKLRQLALQKKEAIQEKINIGLQKIKSLFNMADSASDTPGVGWMIALGILAAGGLALGIAAAAGAFKDPQKKQEEEFRETGQAIGDLNAEINKIQQSSAAIDTAISKYDSLDEKVIKTKEDIEEMNSVLETAAEKLTEDQQTTFNNLNTSTQKRNYLEQVKKENDHIINILRGQQFNLIMNSSDPYELLKKNSQAAAAVYDTVTDSIYEQIDALEELGTLEKEQAKMYKDFAENLISNMPIEELYDNAVAKQAQISTDDKLSVKNGLANYGIYVTDDQAKALSEGTQSDIAAAFEGQEELLSKVEEKMASLDFDQYVSKLIETITSVKLAVDDTRYAVEVLSSDQSNIKDQALAYNAMIEQINKIEDEDARESTLTAFKLQYQAIGDLLTLLDTSDQKDELMEWMSGMWNVTADNLVGLQKGLKRFGVDKEEIINILETFLTGGNGSEYNISSIPNILNQLATQYSTDETGAVDEDKRKNLLNVLGIFIAESFGGPLLQLLQEVKALKSEVEGFYSLRSKRNSMNDSEFLLEVYQKYGNDLTGPNGEALLAAILGQGPISPELFAGTGIDEDRLKKIDSFKALRETEFAKGNTAVVTLLDMIIDSLEDTESFYSQSLNQRIKDQEAFIKEGEKLIKDYYEKEIEGLEQRKKAYEKLYDQLDRKEKEEDYNEERDELVDKIGKLAAGTDAESQKLREQYLQELKQKDKDRLKELQQQSRDDLLSNIDDQINEEKEYMKGLLENSSKILQMMTDDQLGFADDIVASGVNHIMSDKNTTGEKKAEQMGTFFDHISSQVPLSELFKPKDNLDGHSMVEISQQDGKQILTVNFYDDKSRTVKSQTYDLTDMNIAEDIVSALKKAGIEVKNGI